ncbi:type II secretion system F family protein [Brevibacterium daeguense]|uniref:Type II secretion system F family protein n=1 Tax=Brevibacterium daeguense TaxID=909936 RepID=A0ABP8EFT4_9MICO|nr:type II secretion system F family protein [Brevibacterium daeguense]
MSTSLAGALCGLGLGCGLFLVWWSMWETPATARPRPRFLLELDEMLTTAGFPRFSPVHLLLVCIAAGCVVFLIAYAFTSSAAISGCFGMFAALAPYAFVRHRAHSRRVERRTLWPEAIDHLNSGIRAGLSLPEAISGLSVRGPESLRPLFAVFAQEYRATGSFSMSLDRFKDACADPVADRIVAALAVTREVGGTDLGTMLRTLSQFIRDDARTRAEMQARQSWTVTGARLAVAAPWVVLALLSSRPQTAAAYNSPQGVTLLLVGLGVSIAAYAVMKRIGRLPAEPRVLR